MAHRCNRKHVFLFLSILVIAIAGWSVCWSFHWAKQAKLNRLLLLTINTGNESGVRKALDVGADPNTRDVDTSIDAQIHFLLSSRRRYGIFGETVLSIATSDDNVGIVRTLLQRGADPNLIEGGV